MWPQGARRERLISCVSVNTVMPENRVRTIEPILQTISHVCSGPMVRVRWFMQRRKSGRLAGISLNLDVRLQNGSSFEESDGPAGFESFVWQGSFPEKRGVDTTFRLSGVILNNPRNAERGFSTVFLAFCRFVALSRLSDGLRSTTIGENCGAVSSTLLVPLKPFVLASAGFETSSNVSVAGWICRITA